MQRLKWKTGQLLAIFLISTSLVCAFPAGPQNSASPNGDGGSGAAQRSQDQTKASAATPTSNGASGQDLDALKRQLKEQEEEIQKLQVVLQKQAKLLEEAAASKPAKTAPAEAPSTVKASTTAASANNEVASLAPVIPAARSDSRPESGSRLSNALDQAGTSMQGQGLNESDQHLNPAVKNAPEAPISIRIGKADLTPLGFLDATAFFRSTNLGSGIGSSFGAAPFSGTPQGELSETRFSVQNSRLGLMFDSSVGSNAVRAYVETDFLGFQPVNAFVTSNSNSLRSRLYWVDLKHGKFEFLAGQSWSMMTPNRVGLSPLPTDVFYSLDMDTNYQVGLTWARQLQFRFVYHPTDNLSMGLSIENPEQYVGGAVVLPKSFSSTEVDNGTNTATPNLLPDVVGKIAYDGHAGGKIEHVEVAGLLSQFKTYSTTLPGTARLTGGGASVNFNLELFKNFHAVASTFYSDGGGRYIFGLAPDIVITPEGTPSLVHSESAIAGFEYQATPAMMYYGYYGGTYIGRNFGVIPGTGAVTYTGYGFPGSSPSANRSIQEPTFGIIRTFWKNPTYGALQLITQYSYLTRAPWYVAINTPKNAHLSMVYVDVRYILP
jgi:hypothetical protein